MSDEATLIDLTEAAPASAAIDPHAPVSTEAPIPVDDAGEDDEKLPDRAVVNDDGSITLPLLQPVTLTWRRAGVDTSETVSSVTLRRLNGKDVREIMGSTGATFTMKITGAAVRAQYNTLQWAAIYDRMDGADAMDVFLVAQRFLQSGPQTPGR